MAFEKYKHSTNGRIGLGPYTTISKQGQVAVSSYFRSSFKGVEKVVIYYDREARQMGIRPAKKDDWPQRKLSKWGEENESGQRASVVSLRGFFSYFGLKNITGRYPARWDVKEKMLIIQL